MVTCRSCGSNFTGNFCTNCGAPATSTSPLRCSRCNNVAAPNTAFCAYCGTALVPAQFSGQGPQSPPPYPQAPPAYPQAPQQQSNAGKYLMGALGGAAAVIGGEILLHDVERGLERHEERGMERREWEEHHHHHHHHRRCSCGHEFSFDIEVCPRCRRHWGRR